MHICSPACSWVNECQMEQRFVVLRSGPQRYGLIIWSQMQYDMLLYAHVGEIEREFGALTLPMLHEQRAVEIRGDFPGVCTELFECAREREGLHGELNVGLWICLVPNKPGENYGLIGYRGGDDIDRLLLFPDNASGRRILIGLAAEGHETLARAVDHHLPQFRECTLPEESGKPVIELGANTARWWLWWYCCRYMARSLPE